ncbi:hypothetical protein AAZV13_02G079850 [Glycine max]
MINYFVTESMLENAGSSEILGTYKSRVVSYESLNLVTASVINFKSLDILWFAIRYSSQKFWKFVQILESEAEVLETNSTVENLKAALENGFGVEWEANNSLCGECQNSGGHCGYDPISSEFACHCSDRSFPSTCKSGE